MRWKPLILLLLLSSLNLYSQCGPGTPTFIADLSANPSAVWTSPSISRNDNCCGTVNPDRCIKFVITLHPTAVGINFNIVDGAVPTGALFYQIGCGPQIPVGQPICLSGPGPHVLTFCKPGNNQNIYEISSVPPAVGGTNVTINDGCIGQVTATGFNTSTVVWNSIFPGAPGAYNSYLSCASACLNPTITPTGTPPAYIDYQVCGQPAAVCNFASICDTVRVTFNPTLGVTIIPQNPTICFGQTSTTLTAIGSGGTPPYSYLWNSVNPSQSINVGVGTYTVRLSDVSGCPPTFASVTVTSFSVAITANAGADQTVCSQGNPVVTLNGTVTGASGGIWSGGSGSYSPNNTTLTNLSYIPTAAEIAAGSVNIYLTTTGNGTCPEDKDTVVIFFSNFNGTISSTITDVSCFGGNNGSATVSVSGGLSPFTYSWATVPVQTTVTINNLAIGTYSVTIRDGIGCTKKATATITQPAPLAINGTITHVSCTGGSNGTVSITSIGGSSPYSYNWNPGGQTTASITGRSARTYTITVTDSKSCQKTATYTVTQPTPIAITLTPSHVSCFNGADGSANSSVSGGTAPYTYNWTPTNATSPNASGLSARTYTLTVTDNKACTASRSVTINQPVVVAVTVTQNNETCDYLNNGSATASVSGGTAPYTYSWLPGGQTTVTISNLSSGTYTLTVRDSKGCAITTFTTITEPAPLTVGFVGQTNVSCFAGNNGAVTANPSGGTSSYSYSWIPGGATTATITNLTAGTYTVNVTDNNGCQIQGTATITQPPIALNINSAITPQISCNGGNNGGVSITTSGGTGPYTYLWLPGNNTTSSISNLITGTYTVIVTDSKSCQLTATYGLSQPLPIVIGFTANNVSCFNGNNGSATASVTGGTSPYTYTWTPGSATTSNVSGLTAGTYTVTITDSKGCVSKTSVVLIQPTKVIASINKTNETCSYLNNGTATGSGSGGSPGYTYFWQPVSETTATITNLSSGTYTLTTSDSQGCTGTAVTTITQPVPLTVGFISQTNASCFGGNNGKVTAKPTGGTPNYSYLWAPGGATTATISNLAAGTYTVTATDNSGCQTQNTVTITEPLPVLASVISTPTSCNGGKDGSVSVIPSGGTPTYTYKWMPGNNTGQTYSGLSARTYTVTVRDSKNCLGTASITVTQPAPIVLARATINSTCSTANGTASVTATGGTSPYTYQWSPSGGTNASAPNLISGAYLVLVTDNSGCTSTAEINVNDNSGPNATIFSITNVSCYGGSDGSATGGISGGVPPFTYLWSPSGGTNITATGLSAGTYLFTVIDSNGCQSLATTTPPISEPPPIEVNVTTSNVNCFGGNNGTALATAAGGTPGFTYQWLPSGTTGSSKSGLSANTYTLVVTDANNCPQPQVFTITQPALPLSVAVSSLPVSCNSGTNGAVSATASGGTAPYNYNWMSGNFNGESISNLSANTYTVTATDDLGCLTTNSVIVTQPTLIVLLTGSVNSNCSFANGQASVSASGGTGSYTYNWSPSGGTNALATGLLSETYTITVTDANGCTSTASVVVNDNPSPSAIVSSTTNVSCKGGTNGTATVSVTGGSGPFTYVWSPAGGTGATATGLTTGIYTVIVTDVNGCQSPPAFSPLITEPFALSTLISTTNVSCLSGNNGSASATVSGGTPAFTYQWLPGGSTSSSINNLSAGTYTLQVTDSKSCIRTDVVTITQPTLLSSVITASTNVSCFGGNNGAATVSVSGGTVAYNYSWLPWGGNGPSATGLSAGTYTVSINDFNGCTTSSTVTITQPAQPLSATSTGGTTSCSGGSNGTATINPIGGTPGYFYQWSPSGGTSQTASGLSADNYSILVTDVKGCQTNVSLTISEPTAVDGTLSAINPSCGLSNGSITTQISGGTSPYTYLWQPGSFTTATITGLAPGTYTVQVLDALNCPKLLSVTLSDITGPTLNISSSTNVSCFGGDDGTAIVNISQGTSPYTINWLPYGGNALSASGLIAGTYTVNVTDDLGCTAATTVNITEPTRVSISVSSITDVSCDGGNNGTITVSVTGGTGTYTYSWSPMSSSSSTINNITAGTYIVNVMDQNNCPASISINVTQPTTLSSAIGNIVNPTCFNGNNGSAFVSVNGGTLPYSYSWTTVPVQNGNTANNISAGSYTVTVTDAKGCTSTNNVVITHPAQIITTAGVNDTICLGQSGVVTATATGGTGNYSYIWQPLNVTNTGTLTITPVSNITYSVTAYDQNGCQGGTDTVSAIVYSLTPANIQAVATSPICPGQSSVVYVQTSGTTGPLTYSWNNSLGNGPGAYLVTPTQPITYIVTVSNVCGTSVSDSVQILFNPPPVVLTSVGDSTCVPGSLQFYDNSVTGNVNDPITTWLWNFGDGTTSTQQNPTHIFTLPGVYYVSLVVTTGNFCTNNNTSSRDTIYAFQFPKAAFAINKTILDLPYDKLICTNLSTGAITYSWNFGDGGTSTETDPKYLYTTVGNFRIQLIATNSFGCSDTAYREVKTKANIIFPNVFTPSTGGPTGGIYNIEDLTNDIFFPYTSGVVDFKLEIFNRWGELIFETFDIKQGWDGYYRGALCQQDVYVWKAYAKFNNGETFNQQGDVTLLR